MTNLLRAALPALTALCAAAPALAQDPIDEDAAIVVENDLLHPAAGLMNEHMHDGGEAMVGVRWQRFRNAGANRSGTGEISDEAIHAAGYTARTASMEMDMVMLDLMFAPTDDVTLMVMPHYMWHRMTMLGIDPLAGLGGDGHGGHHSIPFGETMTHSTDGFGDTLVSASYRLARSAGFGAHATLGVWVPTGRAGIKDEDGNFVHYGMQPGGGTWDIEPSLTVYGRSGSLGWGAQGAYRYRTEDHNESGFAFGDLGRLSGWVSYAASGSVGVTGRLEYTHEGKVQGHYNAGHNHAAPPDRQENYGGDVARAGVGVNIALPVGRSDRPQLGAEVSVPLYQDLNGIQAPETWRLSLAVSQAF